jgi:protein MpaA
VARALRPRPERGALSFDPRVYGQSAQGRPLEVWLPPNAPPARLDVLVCAGIHGEEPETTVAVSSALRSIEPTQLACAVVLSANPDGLARGTRGNARGVELNRNFPSRDWTPAPSPHKFTRADPQDVLLSPGPEPGSEPETRALMKLIGELRPRHVVAVHAPLACVIDPLPTPLGRWLAAGAGLPLKPDSGGPTPGTLDTWAREHADANAVTFELPVCSKDQAVAGYLDLFVTLLTGHAADR